MSPLFCRPGIRRQREVFSICWPFLLQIRSADGFGCILNTLSCDSTTANNVISESICQRDSRNRPLFLQLKRGSMVIYSEQEFRTASTNRASAIKNVHHVLMVQYPTLIVSGRSIRTTLMSPFSIRFRSFPVVRHAPVSHLELVRPLSAMEQSLVALLVLRT